MKDFRRASLLQLIEQLPAQNERVFEQLALEVFKYQAAANPVYRHFIKLLGRSASAVKSIADIPFMPIELFKTQTIKTGNWQEELVFISSGTTAKQPSRHFLRDAAFYRRHSQRCFAHFYGPLENYLLLALLPSYLERGNSSLVFMVDHFIKQSKYKESGFYLDDYDSLRQMLQRALTEGKNVLLLGVTFALLDFAHTHGFEVPPQGQFLLMETGGMKGRGPEYTREEVHRQLSKAFGLRQIQSEYGMTELLSQAYSQGQGRFRPSPSMRIRIRDLRDPFAERQVGHSGGINIIDLANLDTCSFIATQDIGRLYKDGSFEVLGRSDDSELRGCNLLLTADSE